MIFESDVWGKVTEEIAVDLGLSAVEVSRMLKAYKAHLSFREAKTEFEKCKRWFDWLLNPISRQGHTASNKDIVRKAEGR